MPSGSGTIHSDIIAPSLGLNTGDVTLAAVGSSPSANGASLSAQVLTLQPASATLPGLVTAGTQSFGGIKTFSTQLIGFGTGTNDSAAAGYIGEYIESLITTLTTIPDTSGTYGDLTTIILTAGDWDVTACVDLEGNGGTVTSIVFGISQTTGNSSTGLVLGVNQGDFSSTLVTSGGREFYSIPSYRQSLSTSTSIYFKYQLAYAVATPKYKCRLSARRVR